jgi:hypothetical protein
VRADRSAEPADRFGSYVTQRAAGQQPEGGVWNAGVAQRLDRAASSDLVGV